MDNIQLRLKNEILSVIFSVANGIWAKVLMITVVYSVFNHYVIQPIMTRLSGINQNLMLELQSGVSYERMQDIFQEIMRQAQGVSFGDRILSILLSVVTALIVSFLFYLFFKLAKAKIQGKDLSLEDLFQDAFSPKVLKLFGSYLLIALIYIVAMTVVTLVLALLGGVIGNGGIMFLLILAGLFFVSAFVMRFVIAMPNIVYNNGGGANSLGFSLNKVSMNKGMKYTLIGFLALIVLGIISAIMLAILGWIGGGNLTLSAVLMLVGGIIITSYSYSLAISTMAALFFRSEGMEGEGEYQIEDHLISED